MEYDYWYWRERRIAVLKRDKNCVYCQESLDIFTATIDHLIPKCKGGDDEMANLALSCRQCNEKKGDCLPLNYIQNKIKLEIQNGNSI